MSMNKKDSISSLVEGYYKRNTNSNIMVLAELFKLVEQELATLTPLLESKKQKKALMEALEDRAIRFPKIKITERWGEKHNEDREIFETMMSNVKGNTVQAKVESVKEFLEHKQGLTVPEILSNLMFLEIFSNILEEFNPSTAGFLFEAFLAGLFKGVQISDPEGGSLPIEDVELFVSRGFGEDAEEEITPYSLKVLSPNTDLKGSFKNLVDFFRKGNKSVVYLCVTKVGGTKAVGKLQFYEFEISRENFFDWIGHEQLDKKKIYDDVKFTPASDGNVEGNGLFIGKVQVGSQPVKGKQTDDGFVRAPASRTSKRAALAYQELPAEERVYFRAPTAVTRDPFNLTVDGNPVEPGALIDMDKEYTIKTYSGEDEYFKTGQRVSNYDKLYGDEAFNTEDPAEDLFDRLVSSKGYNANAQFKIQPRFYREMGNMVGEIDLTKQKLKKVFETYAGDLGESLVTLYNQLSLLSININKYFIASDKVAGQQAITNAQEVQKASENIIKPRGSRGGSPEE
jgi:hypothetical protein